MAQRLSVETVWAAVRTARSTGTPNAWLAVAGAPGPADALAAELGRDAAPGAVRRSTAVEGAAALVYVLAAAATDDDRRTLRTARRARVPVVAVLPDAALETRVPYVLATDLARWTADAPVPVDEVARAVAHKLGDEAAALAARVPRLRAAVCESLIASYSKRAAVIGVVVFLPGADMPALTLNQVRLVLLIATAHGIDVDRERLPEVLAVIGSGLALRTAARQVLGAVPVAGWLVKGAIAYAGTRALGEAAWRYFAARSEPVSRAA